MPINIENELLLNLKRNLEESIKQSNLVLMIDSVFSIAGEL